MCDVRTVYAVTRVLVMRRSGVRLPKAAHFPGQWSDRGSSRRHGLACGLPVALFRRSEWVSRGLHWYASLTLRSLLIMVGVRGDIGRTGSVGVTGEPAHPRWLVGRGASP